MNATADDRAAQMRELAANPPIKAPFIYASEDAELINAAKYGFVQMQAALLRERHPEISFDSLVNVVITTDVLNAVHALELRVGRSLVSGRNGAANMPVFVVEVSGKHFLFIGAEASRGLVGAGSIEMGAACEMVRFRLAEVHVQAQLRQRIGGDPRLGAMDEMRAAWFRRAVDAWVCYACARLAYVERISTEEVFTYLERDIEVERRLIVATIDQFVVEPDVDLVAVDIQQWAGFLTNSMAAALGQLHASGSELGAEHPTLPAQIQGEGFTGYWLALEQCFSVLWETQATWTRANDLVELSRAFLSFLSLLGLSFEDDGIGGVTARANFALVTRPI